MFLIGTHVKCGQCFILGVTYDISNKHRLGYSEVQLVQTMIDGVNLLYKEDLELQEKHSLNKVNRTFNFIDQRVFFRFHDGKTHEKCSLISF